MDTNSQYQVLIEFGSNSCKIMQWAKDESTSLQDYRIPLRLAAEIDTNGKLSSQAIKRILQTIKTVQGENPQDVRIIIFGTEALRRIKNQKELSQRIQETSGLKLRVLSSREEGEAAYRAIQSGLQLKGKLVCFDLGGASTEIITGRAEQIQKIYSFPWGAVNLTREFRSHDPISACEYFAIKSTIEKTIKPYPLKNATLAGTGGSIISYAMVALKLKEYAADKVNGYRLSHSEVFRQVQRYRALTWREIKQIRGMDPARADIILPAGMIMLQLMDLFQQQTIVVSSRGVRHGIADLWLR